MHVSSAKSKRNRKFQILVKFDALDHSATGLRNKDRLCKTIASVAFLDTSIERDLRLQTKEILSSRNPKQTMPESFSETQVAMSLVVQSRNGFQEQI